MKVAPPVLSPAAQLARDTARLSLKSQNSFNKHSRRAGWSNSLTRWSNQLALNATTEKATTSQSSVNVPPSNLMSTPVRTQSSSRVTSPCGEEFTPGEMSPTLGYSTLKKCKFVEEVTPKRGSATRRSRRVLNQPVFKDHTTEVTNVGRVQENLNMTGQTLPRVAKNTAAKKEHAQPKLRTLKSGSKLRGSQKKRRKSKGLLCGITTNTDSPVIAVPSPRRSPRIQNMRDRKVPPLLTDLVKDPKNAWIYSPRDFTPIPDFYASFKLPKLDRSTNSESSMLNAVLSTLDRKSRRFKRSPKALKSPEKNLQLEDSSDENTNQEESQEKNAEMRNQDAPSAEAVSCPKKFVSSYSVPQQEVALPGVRVVSACFDLKEIPMIDDEIPVKGKVEETQHSDIPESADDNKTKQAEEAETWKDERMRRPSRKNSFKKAVESPNPSVQSVNLTNDLDNGSKIDTEEAEASGKENIEVEKKSPNVQDKIKSKSTSALTKSKPATTPKPRSSSSATLPQEEEEFKIHRPQRNRSVKFMEQPTPIEAPKESGGTLKRMVSNSGLFKKMKRNRSSEKLRGRKTEEGPLVRDAGRTPRPQRQPKTPFQERLIL